MKPEQDSVENISISIEDVGGIKKTSVQFSSGVTILVGRNATNRTSLLRGLMAALGSNKASIRGGSDSAEVELTIDNETYTRRLMRRSGTIVTEGESYLDDPQLPNLFAFLLESNEARQAVARSDDLRDLIMRPVDSDAIEDKIDRLISERNELRDEIDELNSINDKLPSLEEERVQLQKQIQDKKSELQTKEQKLESIDADVEATREEKAELEQKLEGLQEKRSELDDVRYDLETERESLESLRSEREELEAKLASLPERPHGEIDEIESQIQRLRKRKQELETDINSLQKIIRFNEELLEGESEEMFAMLGGDGETDNQVTNQLLDNEKVTCWTCGSTVKSGQIETAIDHLRELSQQKISQAKDIEEKITKLEKNRSEVERAHQERERIDRQLAQLAREISESEDTIKRLQERRKTLTEDIESIEVEVEELENNDYSELLDLHREANQLEYNLGKLETDLERVEEKITVIEDRLAQKDDVEAQLDEILTEIEKLRTRIERIEQNAIEQFNDHMDFVLDLLEYDNLDRIWLERVDRDVRKGRQKETKSTFELHLIRSTDEGTTYEDSVDHLSESEREVVGLIFALAGYLTHEVYEQVPFMLLDSLEAIDAERIARLIDYIDDYTEYLIVALLPEDAAALSETYERVTNI